MTITIATAITMPSAAHSLEKKIPNTKPVTRKGTEVRQEHLIKGKYFECHCRRCIDPTELGTHLSSMRCQSCTLGYMIRLDCKTIWKCLNCNATKPNEHIQLILCECRRQVQQIGPSIDHIEAFIIKYTQLLHPNHYLLIEMKVKHSLNIILYFRIYLTRNTFLINMFIFAAKIGSHHTSYERK